MSETNGKNQELTLEAARAKLAGQTGKTYWRSVDELAGFWNAELSRG